MKTEKVLKVLKVVGAGALLLGAGFAAGHYIAPKEVTVPGPVEYRDVTVEKVVQVPVEKIVEKEVKVEVESKDLGLVLDYIYDADGDLSSITEDLDDDELDLIVDRIVFSDDVKALAENGVKKDLFDEADNKVITLLSNSTFTLDEDDLEGLKLDTDSGDVEVTEIDYEDKDAEVKVTGRFRQDDTKFKFEVTAIVKDGKYDELKDLNITHYS